MKTIDSNPSTRPVLPARDMARVAGVPLGWLKAEAEAGRLPSLKAGRVFLFHPASVLEALSRRAAGCEEVVIAAH